MKIFHSMFLTYFFSQGIIFLSILYRDFASCISSKYDMCAFLDSRVCYAVSRVRSIIIGVHRCTDCLGDDLWRY